MSKIMKSFSILIVILLLAACSKNPPTASPSETMQQTQVTETASPTPAKAEDAALPEATPRAADNLPDEETCRELYNDYYITAEWNPETFVMTVSQTVEYTNKTGLELENVYFNFYPMRFAEGGSMENENFDLKALDTAVDGVEAAYELDDTALNIFLNAPLGPGETAELRIDFETMIFPWEYDPIRFGTFEHDAWFGNFFPILAVYEEDGWHTNPFHEIGESFYSEISNYTVKITVPAGYTVVGTGERETAEAGAKTVSTFSANMVRDFAFAVSNRFILNSAVADSGVVIYMYRIRSFDDAPPLDVAKMVIDRMCGEIGDYPYRSVTIVEVKTAFTGGMEYPGIVFLDSSYINSAFVIAHELIHQWFYNIIGNDQKTEAWLDEGITSYFTSLCVSSPPNKYSMQLYRDALDATMEDFTHKAILTDVSAYEAWDEYSATAYNKPEVMLYALKLKMGREKFDEFFKLYYERYAFGVATTEGFIALAEEVYGESLAEFFDAWLNSDIMPELE